MLAIWEYFWTEADWTPGSASATATVSVSTVTTIISAGGGGPMIVVSSEPEIALEEFWEVREKYLKRIHSAAEKEIPIADVIETLKIQDDTDNQAKAFAQVVADRERAYRLAQQAESIDQLEAQASAIAKLTVELAEMKAKRDQDDIILILLLTG